MAYEALVAVLDEDRPSGLDPRVPRRSTASKECACRRRCDGVCVRTADGACVPRNARLGFVGAGTQPGQIVRAETQQDAQRVRRDATTRRTRRALADADTAADIRANHNRRVAYSRRGNYLYRIASPKVGIPV